MLLINMKILSHISFFLLLHACLFCCVSCDSRQSAIGTDEICGLWMIDATDLSVVSGLGYSIYTNQVDHLLLLNDDGSCAYRGFEAYAIPRLWDYTEQFQHDSFLQEGSALWPQGISGTKSWYLFNLNPFVFIGPFQTTNGCTNVVGRYYKNKWVTWGIVNPKKFTQGMKEADSLLSARCREHVVLSNMGKPVSNFSGTLYFHVDADRKGLYLWLPTYSVVDYYGEKRIRFRKVGPSSPVCDKYISDH